MPRLWTKWGQLIPVGILVLSCLILASCRHPESFEPLGKRVSSPVAIAASDNGTLFYVLNADFERIYNIGSVLVLDEQGEKKGVVSVPRLGRSLTVAGTDMIVTTDSPEPGAKSRVLLFDLTNPLAPALKADWKIDCSPINAVARKNYQYFFVSCIGGGLYVGELKSPRTTSTFKFVRNYAIGSRLAHRAMHLDVDRKVLIAFPAVVGQQLESDLEKVDKESYDATGNMTSVPNEIPDAWETTAKQRKENGFWKTYQFVVYDIATEAAAGFPFRGPSSDEVHRELRWNYFTLTNFDGTPDSEAGFGLPDTKAYHTNFWAAVPDPLDANAFYLSHRGPPDKSPHANNVIKVSITGDVVGAGQTTAPATADILQFDRVYGFLGEIENKQYPGDINVVVINGQPLLIVNHFRDLLWPTRSDVQFGIATKVIGDNFWFAEKTETDPKKSYYQLAVNQQGKGFTLSVYGDTVIPLDVRPAAAIKVGNPIH